MVLLVQFRTRASANGFSLVELMVVISIISVLGLLSMPKFYNFKAKAAQVEAYSNLNIAFLLVDAFKLDLRPGSGGFLIEYGVKYDAWVPRAPSPPSYNVFCTSNVIGFASTNCSKLRYFYNFNLLNGVSGLPDPYDAIRATNSTGNTTVVSYNYGDRAIIPTSVCGTSGYIDMWSKLDGILVNTLSYKSFCL